MLTTTISRWGAALALTIPTLASAQYQLVWSDEFSGSTLDAANWDPQIGTGTLYGLPAGWGNSELQYYTDRTDNVFVSGGALHIVARSESFGGRSYTSARIRSAGLQEFLYGRIEARIQLPSGQGIWPAFWMLPTTSPYGTWAASGELDVVESVNTATTIYGTAHYGDQWPGQVSNGDTYSPGTNFGAGYHVYAMEWEPDEIRWYVDGVEIHTLTSAQWFSTNSGGNPRAPFDVPFHLLLNVAVGGDFPGSPNGSVGFPMEMLVDYVRVYQVPPPTQEPFGGTPAPIPGTVEAEDFDIGGEGVAYHDFEATNLGGAYRTDEGVDLQPCSEGGFNVGWQRQGEWIEYTVNVQTSGDYDVSARVASETTGGIFHLEFAEGPGPDTSTGTFIAPVTGGWQTWTTATSTVTLTAGEQVMRFVNDGSASSEYNLNWFQFTLVPPPGCVGDINDDGATDVFDFALFGPAFGSSTGDAAYLLEADLDANGVIDVFDFALFGPDFGCIE